MVRHHFRLPDNNRAAVDRLMRDLRQDSDVVIGIHIRHGDYATFMDGRYYYSLDQYAALMHRVVEQLSGQRVKFLVCSNAKWIPEIFEGLDVTPGTGHITEDMYALAETDLIFGPPSIIRAGLLSMVKNHCFSWKMRIPSSMQISCCNSGFPQQHEKLRHRQSASVRNQIRNTCSQPSLCPTPSDRTSLITHQRREKILSSLFFQTGASMMWVAVTAGMVPVHAQHGPSFKAT